MYNQENKFKTIFNLYSAFFIPFIISISHIIIKILYIKHIANYYELDTYYFQHITLDYLFSAMIICTIFLFILNSYNIYFNPCPKYLYICFLLIIAIYYSFGLVAIINYNILSYEGFINFIFLFISIFIIFMLKNLFPIHILFSIGLLIIVFIINFSIIKLKKEYEIVTLKNYQKLIIITLQDTDYLIAPFEEKDNILYLKTKERKWVNRLECIKIESKKYQQVKINSAPI